MTIDTLLKTIRNLDVDPRIIQLAYEYAEHAHHGQKRMTGEPYIVHPLATAQTLAELRLDEETIVAGLVHDVPEDANVPLSDIEKQFGKEVARLVEGVTKLGKVKYRGIERYVESLRKMFVAMAKDIRVVLIKFADRIHNLETLSALPRRKQLRIAVETLEIYAPIANRLGMGAIKGRLEDLAFSYCYPEEYKRVLTLVRKYAPPAERILETARRTILRELRKADIRPIDIHTRKKHLYSLYRKLKSKENNITKIYDLIAARIIVPTLTDCYTALGIVHKTWKPLKGRIKDYIAQPKPNGYQSIHTTIFGPEGTIIEFQIRTPQMHEHAEFGIAAHWHYDEKKGKRHRPPEADLKWVKQLAKWKKSTSAEPDFLHALKIDVFQNQIFVFTPNGDVIELPEDATPVDFAFAIHSEVGNHATAARVNEQQARLDTKLMSGDMVEITTDKNRKGPSEDWLAFVKTSHARQRIRHYCSRR